MNTEITKMMGGELMLVKMKKGDEHDFVPRALKKLYGYFVEHKESEKVNQSEFMPKGFTEKVLLPLYGLEKTRMMLTSSSD